MRGAWPVMLLVASLARGSPPGDLRGPSERILVEAYEHAGRVAPELDGPLSDAAQELAQIAVQGSAADVAQSSRITDAVSRAGGFDPHPRALVLQATPPEDALRALAARTDLSSEPATHLGIGWAVHDGRGSLVLLLVERKATLRPFPRALSAKGDSPVLHGLLLPPLTHAEIFVTQPDGSVQKVLPTSSTLPAFDVQVPLKAKGRFVVEVLAHGPQGPEVVALFFTDVGKKGSTAGYSAQQEPSTTGDAQREILRRVNLLRAANAAGTLTLDTALSAIAQKDSDRMAKEHFFAHVAPDGTGLSDRLKEGGYSYSTAGENLGLASGPLAAHFGIEHSPGHRKNLLEPAFERLGVGISVEHTAGRDQTLLTEILASPVSASHHPQQDAYRALDLNRQQLHLRPLQRNPILERLAREHAQKALELDLPTATLPGPPLHPRIFAAASSLKRASVDLYVTQDLSHLPSSKSLSEGSNDQVGIGAVLGDSPRYGKGRYWVVVIYGASAE